MGDNALAATLIPGIFGAPSGDVLLVFAGAAVALGALSRGTVATTAISEDECQEEDQYNNFHEFIGLLIKSLVTNLS